MFENLFARLDDDQLAEVTEQFKRQLPKDLETTFLLIAANYQKRVNEAEARAEEGSKENVFEEKIRKDRDA